MNTPLILPATPKKSYPFKIMPTPQAGPVNAPKKLEFEPTTPPPCSCSVFKICPPCSKASQNALSKIIRNAPPDALEKAGEILKNSPECNCTPYEICMCDKTSGQESSQKTIITKTKTIEFEFSDPEKARVFEEMVKKSDHIGLKKEYPNLAQQMQNPKKTCPRLVYKGQKRQRQCGKPIHKWGICRRHWNNKYFMLKKK